MKITTIKPFPTIVTNFHCRKPIPTKHQQKRNNYTNKNQHYLQLEGFDIKKGVKH